MRIFLLIYLLFLLNANAAYSQNITQISKNTAIDRGVDDQLGLVNDIHGDYAISSCHSNDYDEAGNNFRNQAGAAYIFEKDINGNWITKQKLVAPDRSSADVFGFHVSIHGNFAVIGAYGQDFDANGNNLREAAGAAYIFERRSNGRWEHVQKIVASDREEGSWFGYTVDIWEDYIVVSAPKNSSDVSGTNIMAEAGAVYVFRKNSKGVWQQVQKLTATDRRAGDQFGISGTSMNGDHLAVCSPYNSTDANGNNFISSAGAVYLFNKENDIWSPVQKIVGTYREPDTRFGGRLSLDGNILAVNSIFEKPDAQGQNPVTDAGAVYFFEKDTAGSWYQKGRIVASDRKEGDRFGLSVSISGQFALIGSMYNDIDASGGDFKSDAGAAYLFRRRANGSWYEVEKFVASDRAANDYFGRLKLDGTTGIVGARYQDTDFAGANFVSNSGAVYFFKICETGSDTIVVSSCDSFISPLENNIWTSSGFYDERTISAQGCDSLVIYDLSITQIDPSVTYSAPSLMAHEEDASYQWFICDSVILPGENSRSFTPSMNGKYMVQIARNGCVDTSDCIEVTGFEIDLDKEKACKLIYPNPSFGSINLDLGPGHRIYSVDLFDTEGSHIKTYDFEPASAVKFETDVAIGVYILKVVNDEGAFYCKVVLDESK